MKWRCPKCEQPLELKQNSLVCAGNHCYDRAKQGYYNLLLANQKNSQNPGDNEEMILARKAFLRAEHYQPLFTKLGQLAIEQFKNRTGEGRILDLGCGEGYYLESLAKAVVTDSASDFEFYGVDISKDAIRRAASSAKVLVRESGTPFNFEYSVASTFHLPVISNEFNLCLNVFAPISPKETNRVLTSDGVLLRVQPGPKHLYEIKQAIYGEAHLHERVEIEEEFKLLNRESLKFTVNLSSPTDTANLLAMTPLHWHGDREAKEKLLQLPELSVTAEFDIQVLGVNNP